MSDDFLVGKGVAVNEGNLYKFTGKYDHMTQMLFTVNRQYEFEFFFTSPLQTFTLLQLHRG